MDIQRRGFLSRVPLIPFFLGLRLVTPPGSQEEAEVAPVLIALDVVRLFNTAELHYHLKRGGYATKDELFDMLTVAWFTNSRALPEKATKSFFSYLRLNDEEIIPGWKMRLVRFDDGAGYVISLIRRSASTTSKTENTVFVSNEKGIIYLGDSDLEYDPDLGPRELLSVPGLDPIDVKLAPRGLFAAMLRKFAFTAQGIQPNTICNCNCTCNSDAGQCYCSNTGCRNCGWCCTTTCTDCVTCSSHKCACC